MGCGISYIYSISEGLYISEIMIHWLLLVEKILRLLLVEEILE
jgi:hypothetical protein